MCKEFGKHGARVAALAGMTVVFSGGLLAQPNPAPPQPPPPPDVHVLIQGGSFLGVHVSEVDSQRVKDRNLPEERGVEITRVEEGSPAEKAGLQKGDIVLDYQGQRVEGTAQFIRLVRETPAGRQVRMTVARGGNQESIQAVIGTRKGPLGREEIARLASPRNFEVWMPDIPRANTSWRSPMLGVEAESLDGQLASFFGVKQGVLIRSVTKGSAAEKAGLKAGDVILRVDSKIVSTPRQLSSLLREQREKSPVTLVLMREKTETSVSVTLEEDRDPKGRFRFAPGRTVVQRPDRDQLD
jgi:serine protease Do